MSLMVLPAVKAVALGCCQHFAASGEKKKCQEQSRLEILQFLECKMLLLQVQIKFLLAFFLNKDYVCN